MGALHPVEALLEKFEAGPGCAARESGNKETHVIAVGRGTSGTDDMVISTHYTQVELDLGLIVTMASKGPTSQNPKKNNNKK